MNQVITAGNTAALLNRLRPFRGFTAINAPQNFFNSNYHSLQMEHGEAVRQRFIG